MIDGNRLLAQRTHSMGYSAIREILKVVSKPGMVSLAGGIPAPESFPIELMHDLSDAVLDRYGAEALQYGTTEGFGPLREVLVDHVADKGVRAAASDILVTSGSQGVLDAVGMALISKGDTVAVEAPTYLGALQAFRPYEPRFVALSTDDGGLIPESLDAVLSTEKVKFVYLVPTFQNPTGRTLSLSRRKAVADLLEKHDALLVEDDPYSDLRYRGEPLPPIKTLAPEHVVYVSTLSKVLAPGLRIGFCVAPGFLKPWLVIVKQGVDLHTNTFSQALAAEYIGGGYLKAHLPRIIDLYRPRREAILSALDRYFPKDFKWSRPDGGMFVWVEGPCGLDAEHLSRKAVEKGVAFVPGRYFYPRDGEGLSTLRLNFTMFEPQVLTRAVAQLAASAREVL